MDSAPEACLIHAPTNTEIYTLSLHDALPICRMRSAAGERSSPSAATVELTRHGTVLLGRVLSLLRCGKSTSRRKDREDRKSTRLNSSHDQISYAVFCLKKKIDQLSVAGPPPA